MIAKTTTSEHADPGASHRPRRRDDAQRCRLPGVISALEAYGVPEFRRRTGLGDYAWRQLRRRLPVRRVGKKQFLLGSDWIAFLQQQPSNAAVDQGGPAA